MPMSWTKLVHVLRKKFCPIPSVVDEDRMGYFQLRQQALALEEIWLQGDVECFCLIQEKVTGSDLAPNPRCHHYECIDYCSGLSFKSPKMGTLFGLEIWHGNFGLHGHMRLACLCDPCNPLFPQLWQSHKSILEWKQQWLHLLQAPS